MTNSTSIAAFTQNDTDMAQAKGSGEVLIATRSRPAEWIDRCLKRLSELSDLQANWDSYGAAAVKPVSIEYATNFLYALAFVQTIERPAITLTPSGNVGLSWDDHTRSMEIEIDDRGTFTYFYEKLSPPMEIEDVTVDSEELVELLTRV